MRDLKSSIIQFCAEIGNDPLFVQGAGGNVSWKDGEALWIKASGTWLADAVTHDIFVPVDLESLRQAIAIGNFSVTPKVISKSGLKPSIETLLHALMPHTVVAHLHAVDILAYLVRRDCENELALLLGNKVSWMIVDYYKPGAELATAIKSALDNQHDATVIFLKNHGLVTGGSDVNEIRQTLKLITSALRVETDPPSLSDTARLFSDSHTPIEGYAPIDDRQLHRLAIDERLFNRLQTDWALYPDHVVFLGPRAHLYNSFDEFKNALSLSDKPPELAFVRGEGVFVTKAFNMSKAVQLRCYYDILERQPPDAILSPLSREDISDLLTRNDEQHRISISKK